MGRRPLDARPRKARCLEYPRVFLDYLEVEGPLYEQWPPKSHAMLLFRADEAEQNIAYAREIFARFLPRAWRRPVSNDELAPILKVVQTELDNGKLFPEAIRIGLAAALTSPKFLYLVEPSTSDEPRPLNEYELASRLAYFLWGSMPDDELFELAAAGKLSNPATLTAQIDRLLADPKIDRFVEGFARQWLKTETFLAFTPDQNLYRSYDEKLAQAVVREPLEFFRTVLKQDLSALNFIDSDFVVVNDRLARHYAIGGVEGEEFRRVALPADSPRGGLLGMAGVHQAGSDGVRTKPVSRAVISAKCSSMIRRSAPAQCRRDRTEHPREESHRPRAAARAPTDRKLRRLPPRGSTPTAWHWKTSTSSAPGATGRTARDFAIETRR